MLDFLKCFWCVFWDDHVPFFFSLLILWLMLIGFRAWNQPCILGINPTRALCSILFSLNIWNSSESAWHKMWRICYWNRQWGRQSGMEVRQRKWGMERGLRSCRDVSEVKSWDSRQAGWLPGWGGALGGEQEPRAWVVLSRPARSARQDGITTISQRCLLWRICSHQSVWVFPVIFKVVQVVHSQFKISDFQVGREVAVFWDVYVSSSS